jgi:HSP20 family molecular chaperone IbpA
MLDLMLREMGGMAALSSVIAGGVYFHVSHNDDAVVITADVPGLGEDDVNVHVAGQILTIEGKSSRHGYERAFRKEFTLADGLDVDRIEAQLERGVLTVLVPKTPKAKPRQIKLGGGVVDKVKGLLGMQPSQPQAKAS